MVSVRRRSSALPRALALVGFVAAAAPLLAQEPQPVMGQPVPGLTPAERARFDAGLVAFTTPVLQSEGAGPIFNEVTCAGCHNVPAIGGFGTRRVTRGTLRD